MNPYDRPLLDHELDGFQADSLQDLRRDAPWSVYNDVRPREAVQPDRSAATWRDMAELVVVVLIGGALGYWGMVVLLAAVVTA